MERAALTMEAQAAELAAPLPAISGAAPRNALLPHARQGPHALAQDRQHHFIGAAGDRSETAVAEGAAHRRLVHVPHAAPILQAGARHFAPQLPGLKLRHRRQLRHVRPLYHRLRRAIDQRTQELDFRLQFGELKVHRLIVEDAAAEGLALSGVSDRLGNRMLGGFEAGRRRPQALFLELHHLVDEALALVADAVALRNPYALEENL